MALLVGLGAGALLTWLVLSQPRIHKTEAEAKEQPGREHQDSHSPEEVKMDADRQVRVGLKIETVEVAKWRPFLVGYGRVLDASPLVNGLADLHLAEVAAAASAKEHVRTRSLFDKGQNASQQAFELAEAAMKRDQLLVESARSRLIAWAGPTLFKRADLLDLGPALNSLECALVRIDLPAGQTWQPPGTVRLASLATPTLLSEAEWIGRTPIADPTFQGTGMLLLLRTNIPPAGTAMLGQFASHGDSEKGWRIPDSSIVRHAGGMWFFVWKSDDTFERRLLQSGRRIEDGWFVTEGVTSDNRIVVRGAQVLLSAQLKGATEEE